MDKNRIPSFNWKKKKKKLKINHWKIIVEEYKRDVDSHWVTWHHPFIFSPITAQLSFFLYLLTNTFFWNKALYYILKKWVHDIFFCSPLFYCVMLFVFLLQTSVCKCVCMELQRTYQIAAFRILKPVGKKKYQSVVHGCSVHWVSV